MPRRATILLVDDDDADLMIAARRLRGASADRYRLLQASNLDEAISTLRVSRVDAVLLDLNLGSSAGPETVSKLRAANDTTLIIATTGHTTPQLERACLEAGADQFLDKSAFSDGEMLKHCVEFALRRPRAKGPSLASQLRALLSETDPDAATDDVLDGLGNLLPGRLKAVARQLAEQGRAPTAVFAEFLDEAGSAKDPSLTLGALAVYLAQAYFEASARQSDS